MNLSAINNLSWIGMPPKDWKVSRVKAVFHQDTTKISVANLAELEVEHYSIPAFDEYRAPVNENGTTIASDKTLLRGGELLFSKLNSHKPRVWTIPIDEKTKVASTEFVALRAWFNERTNIAFLSYLLGSEVFASYISCFQTSVTNSHKRINPEDLLRTVIPLPPLPEQIRIAAYLDASCAAIDAAVNAKKKQIESLEHLREEIIENAVTKGIHISVDMQMIGDEWIGEIPANGTVYRLKRIISAVDYGISESTTQEGRFLVLKMGHIQGGEINVSRNDYVDAVSSNLLLDSGDLLYNRTNSPDQVGKAAIFRGEMKDEITFASYLVRLKTNHRADSYYLNYVLNSRGFLSFARKLAIPSVQQSNLNATRYCRMLVPLPPIEEQRSIRKFLDAKISEVSALFSNIESQIATLIDYRKSLIHECVTGQRRISEADVAKVERTLEQAAGLPQQ